MTENTEEKTHDENMTVPTSGSEESDVLEDDPEPQEPTD